MKTWFKLLFISLLITAWTLNTGIAQHHTGSDKSDHSNIVEIIALDYAFDAPDEIPSGWTTFHFTNEGDEEHFFVPLLLDEGWTFEDYMEGVLPPVNDAWIAHREGHIGQEEALEQVFGMFEEGEIEVGYEYRGGSGIVAPGLSTEVMLYMEPGTYVLECYIKAEDGEFHLMEGMVRELVVSGHKSEAQPPEADIEIIFADGSIEMNGDLAAGRLTFSVTADQEYDNVHIAKIDGDADLREVAEWMDWFAVNGLRHPAPASFIGGMHALQPGTTGYFTVDLEPGRYLFVRGFNYWDVGVLKDVTIEP